MPNAPHMYDSDLEHRAMVAYFRHAARMHETWDQPTGGGGGGVTEVDGRTYVALANRYRMLALFQVRTDGRLKRILDPQDWPEAVLVEFDPGFDPEM